MPLALDPVVVVWIPPHATSTHKSRGALGGNVSFADAVFNVGRTALLVAALAAGDVEALGVATADRLHQDARFAAFPPSHAALADGLDAGAWCGWLSGSGPSVALLCDPADAEAIAAALPADGHTKRLRIARIRRDRPVLTSFFPLSGKNDVQNLEAARRRARTRASSARVRGSGRPGSGGVRWWRPAGRRRSSRRRGRRRGGRGRRPT